MKHLHKLFFFGGRRQQNHRASETKQRLAMAYLHNYPWLSVHSDRCLYGKKAACKPSRRIVGNADFSSW